MSNHNRDLTFPAIVKPLGFYAVVPTAKWVQQMIDAGADTIQLRNKDLTGQALKQEIKTCVELSKDSNSQLFINDYWQLAVELGGYGVHLGQEDLQNTNLAQIANAGVRLGISTHSEQELLLALSLKPSYVAIGAIFATTTKQMPTAPQGLQRLKHYVTMAGQMPTVAIGGINLDNAKQVLATGVSSLAVVSAITQSANPQQVVKQFQKYVTDSNITKEYIGDR